VRGVFAQGQCTASISEGRLERTLSPMLQAEDSLTNRRPWPTNNAPSGCYIAVNMTSKEGEEKVQW